MQNRFDSKPACDNKYLKNEMENLNGKYTTSFHFKGIPLKDNTEHTFYQLHWPIHSMK